METRKALVAVLGSDILADQHSSSSNEHAWVHPDATRNRFLGRFGLFVGIAGSLAGILGGLYSTSLSLTEAAFYLAVLAVFAAISVNLISRFSPSGEKSGS